jgi:hypothetical protein
MEAVAGAGEHAEQRAAAQPVAAQDHHVCHSVCVCVCVSRWGLGLRAWITWRLIEYVLDREHISGVLDREHNLCVLDGEQILLYWGWITWQLLLSLSLCLSLFLSSKKVRRILCSIQ